MRTERQKEEVHPCDFTEACTCKMYALISSLAPFICVSLPCLSLHRPASWLGCWEKTVQVYCQLKVLMAYSCRTHSAFSFGLVLCSSSFSYSIFALFLSSVEQHSPEMSEHWSVCYSPTSCSTQAIWQSEHPEEKENFKSNLFFCPAYFS